MTKVAGSLAWKMTVDRHLLLLEATKGITIAKSSRGSYKGRTSAGTTISPSVPARSAPKSTVARGLKEGNLWRQRSAKEDLEAERSRIDY